MSSMKVKMNCSEEKKLGLKWRGKIFEEYYVNKPRNTHINET